MTISTLFTITQRVWRGWRDPGLPVGAYIAATTVQGDASGGRQLVIFQYALEGDPVSGRYYNIEQLTSHISTFTAINGGLTATNWESVGPTGLADRVWALRYETDDVNLAALAERQPQVPVFLGTPQPVPALASQVSIGIPNVLNRVLFAQIQGYIWEARSVNVDGGLRRPVESLYG